MDIFTQAAEDVEGFRRSAPASFDKSERSDCRRLLPPAPPPRGGVWGEGNVDQGIYPDAEAKKPMRSIIASVFEAEAEGFEPPERCRSTVFKTAAIDHSATPPIFLFLKGLQR